MSSRPKILELGSEEAVWEWKEGSKWVKMDPNSTNTIEQTWQKNKNGTVDITANYTQYKIYLSTMEQENLSTYNKRQIRRTLAKTNVRKVDVSELNKLYEKYHAGHSEDDGIEGEGVMNFCADMQLQPEDLYLLVLFWKLNCDKKYFLTETQFIRGMAELGFETITKIKSGVPKIKSTIADPKVFRAFYSWTFDYLRDPSQKRLAVEIAVPTWKLIFADWKYIDDWSAFVQNHGKEKTISKDVWSQLQTFVNDKAVQEKFDLTSNEDNSYPVIIDEFCEYMRKRQQK